MISITGNYPPDLNPFNIPGVWARWDSGYYLKIATDGYKVGGSEVNFFPLYPILSRLAALNNISLIPIAAFLVSNIAFCIACLLLWNVLKQDFGEEQATASIIFLNVFPTAFFFSAIYSESVFLLFSVLVYWFSSRKQYILAGVCVGIAALGRINGLILCVIPIIEIILTRPSNWKVRILSVFVFSILGLGLYSLYLWLSQGNPLAFISSQQSLMKRSITLPGLSVLDSIRVVLYGSGGFENNWFMRFLSIQDLVALGLFVILTILSFRYISRKSLVAFMVASIIFLLMSHGPYTLGVYAMARYVLVVFPGFVVIGFIFLSKPRLKWVVWIAFVLLSFAYTGWFVSGRWVA